MISFVVPVLNEEESLVSFKEELDKGASKLDKNYEIIFVDDGSTDKSLEILQEFAKNDKRVRIFSFRRNLGKSEALTYGFQKAKGDHVVTLDADLQDKPSEIYKLIEKQKVGYDVVSGWRKDRRDKTKMVFISKLFNNVASYVFDVNLHDYNCGLKIYTNEAAKSLRLYGGLHRFIPLLAYQQGFTVAEVPVIHEIRKYGKSKYGFSKLWKDLPDMFTMLFLAKYSKRPLHFFGLFGFLFSFIGIIILIYFVIAHSFYHQSVGGRPLLYIGLLLVIAGLQIAFTGFLADLMINISHEPELLDERNLHFPIKYSTD